MTNSRTDQPASHPGKPEKTAAPDVTASSRRRPKDPAGPASKPQGTLEDQVKTMESEGQAQPQEGDRTPEELEREAASKKR